MIRWRRAAFDMSARVSDPFNTDGSFIAVAKPTERGAVKVDGEWMVLQYYDINNEWVDAPLPEIQEHSHVIPT